MTPAALQLRAQNNLARLSDQDRERVSWLLNAGAEDTKRQLQQMTGTPDDIRVLEVAIDVEKSAGNRPTRIKPIQSKLSRFSTEVLAPEALLDGTASNPQSPIHNLQSIAWEEAGRLAGLAKNYARASTAAKALCGIRLRALREHYFGPRNPNGGRPKKTPNDSAFSTWESMLADHVGITRDTGENWMKMADAVEALADRENLDLRTIVEKLPWDWTTAEAEAVERTVHHLTEDKTQRQLLQSDFLTDLGYSAPQKPNSSNNPTGANGGKKKPARNPQELLRERQEAARLIFTGTIAPGRVEHGSVAMFMETFIGNAGKDMEALPQAELRDFYEHTVKPFATAFRKLAGL